jgi:hypothetical protein
MHKRLRSVKSGPLSQKRLRLYPMGEAIAQISAQLGVARRPLYPVAEGSRQTSVSIRLAGPAAGRSEGSSDSQSESDGA